MAATALALLQEFGRSDSVLKRFSKTLNPVTGQTSAVTVVQGNICCAMLPWKVRKAANMADTLSDGLKAGRLRYLLIAALGVPFAPEPTDIVFFDSAYWMIEGVMPVNPAGTPLTYDAFVSRTNLSAADAAAH